METPSYYGGFAADLANYSTATLNSAYVSPADSQADPDIVSKCANLQVMMVNNGMTTERSR